MREIKFRGKRLSDGAWVYGDLYRVAVGTAYIRWYLKGEPHVDAVDADTVGQFTGEYDKNEVEIYEGDVVIVEDITMPFIIEYRLLDYDGKTRCIGFNVPQPSRECEVIRTIHYLITREKI